MTSQTQTCKDFERRRVIPARNCAESPDGELIGVERNTPAQPIKARIRTGCTTVVTVGTACAAAGLRSRRRLQVCKEDGRGQPCKDFDCKASRSNGEFPAVIGGRGDNQEGQR